MQNKKKLGIIGGMGSRAGACLLQKIIDYSPAETDQEFLEIIFHNNSCVPDRTRSIVYNEPSPLKELLRSVNLFNENKVEVIALGCITAYYYYKHICNKTSAKVINPLLLALEQLKKEYAGVTKVGLLATTGTIQSRLFHSAFSQHQIEVITLGSEDQENLFMKSVYMKNGFKSAKVSLHARELMKEAMERLSCKENVELIIGGCTEVSLGLDPASVAFPYIDALDLLAKKIVTECYQSDLIKI